MKNICVEVIGGLGNQLFQYAAGYALSRKMGCSLTVDLGGFKDYQLRMPLLSKYVPGLQVESGWKWIPIRENWRSARVISNFMGCEVIKERSFQYQELKIGPEAKKIYLKGFWQSPKYFSDFSSEIKTTFTLSSVPSPQNANYLQQIRSEDSVCLHVRRGDYATNPVTNQYHGLCSLSYYSEACKRVLGQVARAKFFVFSDDLLWCKENLRQIVPNAVYVSANSGDEPHEDLRLMSSCNHHIIANSSLSWWGAWLRGNDAGVVVAPSQWFKDPSINTKDLIPTQWVRLPNF